MTQTYVNFPPCPCCRSRSVVFIKERRKVSRFAEQKYQLRCNDCGNLGIVVEWVEQPLWEYSYVPKRKQRRPALLVTFAQYFGVK